MDIALVRRHTTPKMISQYFTMVSTPVSHLVTQPQYPEETSPVFLHQFLSAFCEAPSHEVPLKRQRLGLTEPSSWRIGVDCRGGAMCHGVAAGLCPSSVLNT